MGNLFRRNIAKTVGASIALFAHLITAARTIWKGIEPTAKQRVYYANHCSTADTVLIWSALPLRLRKTTRPVAAADYWLKSKLREFIGRDVFNAVLIDRRPEYRAENPVDQMVDALDEGASLIIFPEGTRNDTDEDLLPFKTGIFHLSSSRNDIDLVPVWINHLNEVLPKGEIIPIPLLCTVCFGHPIKLEEGESKESFLERSRSALLNLKNAEISG